MKIGPLTFQSNKTGTYHEDMKADVLEEMLKYLPVGSVAVMYNASYHSRRIEQTLTSWRKQEIVDWLTSDDIQFQAYIINEEPQ